MNRRLGGLAMAAVSLVACSSSNSGGGLVAQDSGSNDAAVASNDAALGPDGTTHDASNSTDASDLDAMTVTQTVGPSGGTVTAPGAVLTIPQGALPSGTTISVQPNAGTIPPGYTALTPLFDFGPDGTALQKPATVSFTLSSAGTSPTVYWTNGSGGYDALATNATATTASASVTTLGTGFVADLVTFVADAGAPGDAGNDAAEPSDAGTTATDAEGGGADGAVADAQAAADGGDAGLVGFSLTVDNASVPTVFAANESVTTNGNSIWTITAATNGSGVNWTVSIQVNGLSQQAVCQLGGYPLVTYTDYVNAAPVAVFSTQNAGSNCTFSFYSTPTAHGQYAQGSFTAKVVEAADAGGASHTLTGTYNLLY
jgi:hypothetical protein